MCIVPMAWRSARPGSRQPSRPPVGRFEDGIRPLNRNQQATTACVKFPCINKAKSSYSRKTGNGTQQDTVVILFAKINL